MPTKISANVRMYRLHELGDCFLLTFTSGKKNSRMLVDCGSFRNSQQSIARLTEIVGDIKKNLNRSPLDVVVATHQHNDHVNGFFYCSDMFRKIGVEQVWLSWLDDPRDTMAREIGKAHNNLKMQLAAVRDTTEGFIAAPSARPLQALNDILGFYSATGAGNAPDIPERGIESLRDLASKDPKYLRPGQTLEMPGLPEGQVRIHVLGPPREPGNTLLYRKDPRKGESYDRALANATISATKILDAVNLRKGIISREEQQYPFAEIFKYSGDANQPSLMSMIQRYNDPQNAWRKIDDDWMEQVDSLALYLDTFTNNASIVLAVELVESRKVLLFAGDAQTGNWLSWSEVKWENKDVSTDDLLARTVFYKVGHHASHNATLVKVFEKMNHPDLTALIPVDKKDANIIKENGWKMPARNLFKRLMEKTENRVLQMDGENPLACDPKKDPAKSAWKKLGIRPQITDLFIELTIAG
jgi:beta-lactamase superfamily II metal-dependent hydrolase